MPKATSNLTNCSNLHYFSWRVFPDGLPEILSREDTRGWIKNLVQTKQKVIYHTTILPRFEEDMPTQSILSLFHGISFPFSFFYCGQRARKIKVFVNPRVFASRGSNLPAALSKWENASSCVNILQLSLLRNTLLSQERACPQGKEIPRIDLASRICYLVLFWKKSQKNCTTSRKFLIWSEPGSQDLEKYY